MRHENLLWPSHRLVSLASELRQATRSRAHHSGHQLACPRCHVKADGKGVRTDTAPPAAVEGVGVTAEAAGHLFSAAAQFFPWQKQALLLADAEEQHTDRLKQW